MCLIYIFILCAIFINLFPLQHLNLTSCFKNFTPQLFFKRKSLFSCIILVPSFLPFFLSFHISVFEPRAPSGLVWRLRWGRRLASHGAQQLRCGRRHTPPTVHLFPTGWKCHLHRAMFRCGMLKSYAWLLCNVTTPPNFIFKKERKTWSASPLCCIARPSVPSLGRETLKKAVNGCSGMDSRHSPPLQRGGKYFASHYNLLQNVFHIMVMRNLYFHYSSILPCNLGKKAFVLGWPKHKSKRSLHLKYKTPPTEEE